MNPDIIHEVTFLFYSVLTGIFITFFYDLLRVFRKILPHNDIAVSVEDFFYWIGCSFAIFWMLYQENNGTLRWFAIVGATLGMFFYKKTIGIFFVKIITLVLLKILHLVEKILLFFLRPLVLVFLRAKRRGKRSGKWLKMGIRRIKKKLTAGKKMLKMILCKQ